ncbi:Protein of unknown function [Bacillus thuringiensis]|uniref:Uncharacterized protein n=1 Tax=Bacillus thuringiensis TaxID=1428 RepID=A0A1C4D1A2_BACTU|nr:Protein of unknown function [Bacillus thuringiensis]SCL94037.1 Protein of unknown function [Bacillus wiedmannii]
MIETALHKAVFLFVIVMVLKVIRMLIYLIVVPYIKKQRGAI